MNERDGVLLRDMRDAARRALRYVAGKSRDDVEANDFLLGYAVVKAIEIIGEAASRVSPETHDALSGIQWPEIIGMRHRVVHDYANVDYDIVWRVVTADLETLIGELDKVLSSEDAQNM